MTMIGSPRPPQYMRDEEVKEDLPKEELEDKKTNEEQIRGGVEKEHELGQSRVRDIARASDGNNIVKTDLVRGSRVKSVSSSPLRISKSEKILLARRNSVGVEVDTSFPCLGFQSSILNPKWANGENHNRDGKEFIDTRTKDVKIIEKLDEAPSCGMKPLASNEFAGRDPEGADATWMGRVRDGNPRVTPEVTRDVCLPSRHGSEKLKGVDREQLLEIGIEGFYKLSNPSRVSFNPNALFRQVGIDFICNHGAYGINFASTHIYTNIGISLTVSSVYLSFVQNWTNSRSEDCQELSEMLVISTKKVYHEQLSVSKITNSQNRIMINQCMAHNIAMPLLDLSMISSEIKPKKLPHEMTSGSNSGLLDLPVCLCSSTSPTSHCEKAPFKSSPLGHIICFEAPFFEEEN
eukprot:Gb_16469 [translate_table: standard]